MANNWITISAYDAYYNRLIILKIFYDEVIPLPNNKIEKFHDDLYSLI